MLNKISILAAMTILLASCTEFGPVGAGHYREPEKLPFETEMKATHTISQLVSLYTEHQHPVLVTDDIIISGKVTTTDKPGNFYKSLYIQDETGGIEVKIGRNALYNDYQPGQTIFVKCQGLTLGEYGYKPLSKYGGGCGMVQIGYSDETGEYETSYFENPLLIDNYVFKGELGPEVEPEVIEVSQLPHRMAKQQDYPIVGKLVTLKNLKYDNKVFALLYIDSNKNKKDQSNRFFLADEKQWGITTWAMSKLKMIEYIESGIWDSCSRGDDKNSIGDYKGDGRYPEIEKNAYSVSQYFALPGVVPGDDQKPVGFSIRTSGYCKFADQKIDPDVLSGKKLIDATGILTRYQGDIQFIIRDLNDIKVHD